MVIILYTMNYAPELSGVAIYSVQVAEYLADRGWEVVVITTPPHYPQWQLLNNSYRNSWSAEVVNGVTIVRSPLYLTPKMGGLKRLWAPLSFAFSSVVPAIWQIVRRRPDIVLVIEPTLLVAPFALLAATICGARTILYVQDLEVHAAFAMGHLKNEGLIRQLLLGFEKMVRQRFCHIITIGDAMKRRIVETGVSGNCVSVVRNWVDLDLIRVEGDNCSYRDELGLKAEDFVVLYSGSIGAKQGITLLIEAAALLADYRNIVFVVAGGGPMRAEVEDAGRRIGNICLLDFQPLDRFSNFLGVANLHLLPQRAGAADLMLPSKLGPMLASGRQIVATANPGTELQLFLNDACVLISPGDARALSQAILDAAGKLASSVQMEKRLELAKRLSKTVLIQEFYEILLFVAGDRWLKLDRKAEAQPRSHISEKRGTDLR